MAWSTEATLGSPTTKPQPKKTFSCRVALEVWRFMMLSKSGEKEKRSLRVTTTEGKDTSGSRIQEG